MGDPLIEKEIEDRLQQEGFDVVGITTPSSIPKAKDRLAHFLDEERQGAMSWMEERSLWRGNPAALWPEAKSIIMAGMNYAPPYEPMALLAENTKGIVSCYAQGKDYHDLMKKRLKAIARWLHQSHGAEVKVFVDTAPVMEKPLAEAAGLGWQGKHTNLVSRTRGSWLFLGAIFTTLTLKTDAPHKDHCGDCRACLDICPTKAFPAPYQLDARRCISYLTIEHKGHIAEEFRTSIGNRIYGCDDCLAVCPWNKFAQQTKEIAFQTREALTSPLLAEFAALDDSTFRTRFSGSPVKRIGRDRFIRNTLIAMGNSGESALIPYAQNLLEDASPIVRAMAVWACKQLMTKEEFSALSQTHLAHEEDNEVAREWQA